MITKIISKYSICVLHLFMIADIFLRNTFEYIRRTSYNAYPYILYSILRLLILGILITVYIYHFQLNRIWLYRFLLVDFLLLGYFIFRDFMNHCEIIILVIGIIVAQLLIERIKDHKRKRSSV